jgi:hypothetical protein
MRELHAKAALEIIEEEKRRKKRLAITEASASANNSHAGDNQTQKLGLLGSIPNRNLAD